MSKFPLLVFIVLGASTARAEDATTQTPPTVTISKEELEKLIDARIAKAAAAAPAASPTPTPTVGDGQKEVKAPFAFGDFSWMPGNAGASDRPLTWGPFTGELRLDAVYHYELSNPIDHTIGGSSEALRSNELQVTQLGFGGDFLYKNIQARLMTQFGVYSQATPRGDASSAQGQWSLDNAYRYIAEAWGGYHIPVMNGINIQAGIFLSYVGMWSYYNFDNWTYQPSFVSQNTPWYFNGARVQVYPSERLKIEVWLVNGWQSYGKFNEAPGVGLQLQWRPKEWLAIIANQYFGTDTLGVPDRKRIHSDDSIAVRWYRKAKAAFSQGAASLTLDAGCEFGNGNAAANIGTTTCSNQYFVGMMAYARLWFFDNRLGATLGGGVVSNPGRYLMLIPPVNGATSATSATAPSGTSPYFTTNVGDPFQAWDMQATADYMPNDFMTVRFEYTHRAASVPYFVGHGGVTPCVSGICTNQGPPGTWPGKAGGAPLPTTGVFNNPLGPDLVPTEDRLTLAMLLKF